MQRSTAVQRGLKLNAARPPLLPLRAAIARADPGFPFAKFSPFIGNFVDTNRVVRALGGLMAINEYRRHAFECLCIADDTTTNPENRMLLIAMAQAWLKLAQRAEQDLCVDIPYQPSSPSITASAAPVGCPSVEAE